MDYDLHQHAVYSRGRELTPTIADLWVRVLGAYIASEIRPAILDLGSGTGMYSTLLAEAFDTAVVGVEPSARMRAVAEREHAHPRVRYVEGSAERVPLRDGSCDIALLSNMIHHVRDRRACIAELARVLRPRGLVLVRGTLRDSLGRVPWLEYFPSARPVAERQLPSVTEVVELFVAGAFDHVASEVVEQETAPGLRAYADRVGTRAISTLELISDADFRTGVERMLEAAQRESSPRPVFEAVDLVVCRRR